MCLKPLAVALVGAVVCLAYKHQFAVLPECALCTLLFTYTLAHIIEIIAQDGEQKRKKISIIPDTRALTFA